MNRLEWMGFVHRFWKREEGQTMAEYGIVLAVITVAAVGVLTLLSGGITRAFTNVTAVLP